MYNTGNTNEKVLSANCFILKIFLTQKKGIHGITMPNT